MQTRSCDEISVCLSVRLSVKRVHCDKTYTYVYTKPTVYNLKSIANNEINHTSEALQVCNKRRNCNRIKNFGR